MDKGLILFYGEGKHMPTKKIKLIMLLCIVCLGVSYGKVQSEDTVLVIQADKIYTASQGVIKDGKILIRNGKIAKLGTNMSVPHDATVITAKVVIPGLIDIHTHLGVYSLPMVEENSDGNEMTNPITPQVHALDSFNFDDPALKVGLAGGVTTIISRPGSGNVIGGTSVAVKLKSAAPEEMVIREICDLKMAIEGNPVGVYGNKKQMPSTLMGVYHLARKAFMDAQEYQSSWENYEKEKNEKKDVVPPQQDLGKDILVKALKREIPVHIHCATASEIMSCIRLAREFNLQLSLGHCYWAYLIVDELKHHPDVHFNVGPPMFFNYYQNALQFKNTPAILSEAGLEVSLQTDALGGGQQNLLHLAALCVRYGMQEDAALKSITLNAAKAVNLETRIGSISEGKDADLVLLDGEPFEIATHINQVLIDGKVEYTKVSNFEALPPLPDNEAQDRLELPEGLLTAVSFALKAGTIYTMRGDPLDSALENGTIIVRGGKIEKIGRDIAIPVGLPVIEAGEFTVMPGLVNPRSYVGIASNWRRQSSTDEISQPIVPEMEVLHAIEPQAPQFSFARELGITTLCVTPGNRNVMGGQGAILKTAGQVVDNMVAKNRAVMVFGLGVSAKRSGQMPSTRMGIAALLRETLTKAQEYKANKDKAAQENKSESFKKDWALEALLPVLAGETPVVVHCERQDDILTTLRIADEYGLKVILDGAIDAHKVIPQLKKRGIPVIIEDLLRGAGNIEDKDFDAKTPARLAAQGIRIAFRASEGSWTVPGAGNPGGDLLEIAAFAHKNGLPADKALQAVTIDAARIIGWDQRIGSLEPGKDADILILRGHPLRTKSIPEVVFIDGKLVYKRQNKDHL
jgi:imidazolonepropionase-like amidohydrolase